MIKLLVVDLNNFNFIHFNTSCFHIDHLIDNSLDITSIKQDLQEFLSHSHPWSMPSHYETESKTTLKEEYEATNAKAFKKINRLTMISYFIAYSFFDQNIELAKKCMDLINQVI